MTTDNVYDLSKIHKISGEDKVLRIDGIKSTLNWLLKKRNESI